MKRYNTYIKERRLELGWLDTEELTKKEFDNMLNSNDFSDFNEDDKPIYRSIDLREDFYFIKPTGKLRRSAYCPSNHYTLLINNLPSWSEYPKRIHVCSNKYFRFNRSVYRVIPMNGSKVGICPNDDIQAPFKTRPASIELFRQTDGSIKGLLDLTYYYNNFSYVDDLNRGEFEGGKAISDTDWDKFKEDLEREKQRVLNNSNVKEEIKKANTLLDENKLNELLKPEGLGFECITYNEYKNKELGEPENRIHRGGFMREVWLDCPILLQKV